jgi:hypothetical protein
LFCAAWAHALKVFVSDNKEVMRDYYLGCKLAYHAVSGTDVEEEVPDEVLVVCYADTIIPHGTKLRFRQDLLSERYYF